MAILESLKADQIAAMKAKDAARLGVVRFLLAQVQRAEMDKRQAGNDAPITDDEALAVLDREAKKRREAIRMYQEAQRTELADQEQFELGIIESYLPVQLTDDEITALATEAIANAGTDFGAVMRELSPKTKGRADGSRVSGIVKALLG